MKSRPRVARAALLVLFFALSMATLGLVNQVHAASIVNQQWCSSVGGTWNSATSTCTNPICTIQPAVIAAGDNLTIPQGTTVVMTNDCWITINGALTNKGTIQIMVGGYIRNNNSFANYGTILSSGTIQTFVAGAMTNEPQGTIKIGLDANGNKGNIVNQGRFTNIGALDSCGVVTNQATIFNYGNFTNDNCHVQGQPGGDLNNALGIILEECGGALTQVSGSTNEPGTVTNSCTTTSSSSTSLVPASISSTTSSSASGFIPEDLWFVLGGLFVVAILGLFYWRWHSRPITLTR